MKAIITMVVTSENKVTKVGITITPENLMEQLATKTIKDIKADVTFNLPDISECYRYDDR